MKFSGKKQAYKLDKIKRKLVKADLIDLQEQRNSFKNDTLDAVLRRLLDNGCDPCEVLVTGRPDIDMDSVIDDFSGDVFELASSYTEHLGALGIDTKDPMAVLKLLTERMTKAEDTKEGEEGLLAKAQQTEGEGEVKEDSSIEE